MAKYFYRKMDLNHLTAADRLAITSALNETTRRADTNW